VPRGPIVRQKSASSAIGRATAAACAISIQDRPRPAIGLVQLVVSAVSVSLENPSVPGEMRLGMFARPIARVIEHRSGRRGAAER
jgi:hypothetical protein